MNNISQTKLVPDENSAISVLELKASEYTRGTGRDEYESPSQYRPYRDDRISVRPRRRGC